MIWYAILLLAAAILAYVLCGRAWLKTQPWAQGFFDLIEPIEIALFKKSETMLVGRLLWFGGLLVTFYDAIAVFASALDWTPVTTRLLADVPPDMRGLIVSGVIGALGLLINWLRKRTTKPIEIVALPEQNVPPEVARAVERAEIAKDTAVAKVEEAQAKGTV